MLFNKNLKLPNLSLFNLKDYKKTGVIIRNMKKKKMIISKKF
jgi:hypothetical protein